MIRTPVLVVVYTIKTSAFFYLPPTRRTFIDLIE